MLYYHTILEIKMSSFRLNNRRAVYRKYTNMWAHKGPESRSGRNIGNNHNLADMSFDSNFDYFQNIYLEHKSNIIKL